jgi:lysophospholipase L1-like esterase
MILFLTTLSPPRAIQVACVGDSITYGSGYTDILQSLLGNHYSVSNFGVNGAAVTLNSSKPYMSLPAFRSAQISQPDIVVIMLGTNDANPSNYSYINEFTADYETMIHKFQSLQSTPDIYIVEPPPIGNNTLGLSNESLVQNVIPGIDQAAGNNGLPVIDVYSALTNHTEYFGDGVHPNQDGAQIIAEQIDQSLLFNGAVVTYPALYPYSSNDP